jgi:hypothetical protein
MGKSFVMLFGALAFFACSQQQPATTSTASTAATNRGGLRKISTSDQQIIEQLRQRGVKILVQQPDYVLVYSDSSTLQPLDTQPVTEKDIVQRLAKIHFADKTQLQQIVDLGVDVWEVKGDSMTARVYDWYLEQLKQGGFSYRILKMDASAKEGK